MREGGEVVIYSDKGDRKFFSSKLLELGIKGEGAHNCLAHPFGKWHIKWQIMGNLVLLVVVSFMPFFVISLLI